MKDSRYAAWLKIADDLDALHSFAFGQSGPWSCRPESDALGTYAAQWIRKKCATGWWYWWDKSTIYAKAIGPVHCFNRIEGEGGLDDTTDAGKELKSRIERLRMRIDRLNKGLPAE